MISFIPILWYFTEISTFHGNINQSILFSKAYHSSNLFLLLFVLMLFLNMQERTICREYTRNSQICEMQNRKKKCVKENNQTKQYLRDLAICLRPRSCSPGKRYRTVPAGTASMCISTEAPLFRIGLNTGCTGQYWPIQKKKKKSLYFFFKFCNFQIFVRVEW